MRLGLLIYGSLETVSGGYLYDRKLVQHLRDAGDKVKIISLPWRSYPRHLGDNFSTFFRRQLQGLEIDVLLQDELNHPSLFVLNERLKKWVDYPVLSIVHHLRSSEAHPVLWNMIYREIERTYLDKVDGFIFNSQTTRQAVENLLGKETSGVVALPAGDRFTPPASQEVKTVDGPLRLLFLGNVIRRKGLDWALQELEQLPGGSWQLDVVGSLDVEPAFAAALKRQVERMGAQERVRFHGALSDAETQARLQASQVLVVPSSYEGFGIVYLEAMGFGVVPLGSALGGAGEVIEHGQNGFLVNPGQAGELRRALEELLNQPGRLSEMSRAARQRYLGFPGWEASMQSARQFIAQFVQDWNADEG